MLVRSVPEAPELQKSPVSTLEGFTVAYICLVRWPRICLHGTVVHIFHLLMYLNLYAATGGLAAGAIAGIVIVAVVFALLLLMIIAVIIWHKRSHAKNKKSTNILRENNRTTVGDLQAECHQAERPQSYAQSLDTMTPKDSTHSDNQSNTVSQTSDRRRFLKREVCTSLQGTVPFVFVDIVVEKTITRTRSYILQHRDCFFIILLLVFFFLQYSDVNSYSFIDEEAETNLSHEARLISELLVV